ncbi:ATP-binding protein [Aquimarina brevivitae]|uniref:histidine kinase n=1 Tax=Aquimarina brevivitae TaxID=323412 RepID=A0A4Q7NVN0_9FLAO|nr:ATP-binding protein [Aquimarina brevivitae]RZS90462.1 PAS domain S-box-containing protein [Aquimarina brevivitae]
MAFTIDQISVLTERTQLFLVILNKEGEIVNCNSKCNIILKSSQAIEKYDKIYKYVIDEDKSRFQKVINTISEDNPILYETFGFPITPEGIITLKLEFILKNDLIYATGIDITTENKEHRALEVISKLTKTGAWNYNPLNERMYWSEGCYRIHELDPNTPMTKNLSLSFFPENSRTRIENYFECITKNNQSYTFVEKISTAKGSEKWVKVKAKPIMYQDEVVFVNGTMADITDRYNYIEELKYNEETKNLALKGIKSGLFDHHLPKNIVFYSEDLKKMIGLPLDKDFIPEEEFRKLIHPEDVDEALQRHQSNLRSQNPYYFNHYRLNHLGEEDYRYYEVYGYITYDKYQNPKRLIGNLIDVDEKTKNKKLLKESKKNLQAMINNGFAYILLLNTKGEILMADDLSIKIIKKNYDVDPIAKKSKFIDVMPLNFKDTFTKDFETALEGKSVRKEFERITLNGTTQWLESKYTPIEDEEGKVSSVLASFLDVTETKIAELAIKEAHLKEQELGKLKTNILSNFSHEIRTPLNGIMTITKLLLKEEDVEERKKLLNLLSESEDRLLHTLDNLSNLRDLESIEHHVALYTIDVNYLVSKCFNKYKKEAFSKNLSYELMLDTNSPSLKTDQEFLKISISHIIHNAIKYTNDGKIEIKVESDENNVYITIRDTGIGIKQENLNAIFEPFVQESIGLSRKYEGTGIGLSLAKRYIEVLGGNINAKSKSGKGTDFKIIIPKSL